MAQDTAEWKPSVQLSNDQASALFDILTHHETYSEIEAFKDPGTISHYGDPFQSSTEVQPTTPILQNLFTRLGLPLPGLKGVNSTYWPSRILPLVKALSSANLSESYDKGSLGQRKTISTAFSVLLEYLARGYFGGLERHPLRKEDGEYDIHSPLENVAAWEDLVQTSVYGDAIDQLFSDAAKTSNLDKHPLRVQAAHRYIVLNLASILHFIFVVSPKGPSILGLLESVHKLIPYALVRSTLRIGNAASMINAMVKVCLAKASVGAAANWLGVGGGGYDEGMNLLQVIISTVLGWDTSSLKKRLAVIEKSKEAPSKDQLNKLKAYVEMSQEEQQKCRAQSKSQGKSIVAVILADSPNLSNPTHSLALDYLSIQLSIADRQRLIAVTCRQNPDILTPVLRDLVTAYEPVIRAIHNAVDLSATVYDAQLFLDDFIKLSKKTSPEPPSVLDYVSLLEKHQASSHRFLHEVAKNGKEIRKEYQDFVHQVAAHFRRPEEEEKETSTSTTSSQDQATRDRNHTNIKDQLAHILQTLPSNSDRTAILNELDLHAAYLSFLHQSSTQRLEAVFSLSSPSSSSSSPFGPGAYIQRWQSLLDETEITPSTPEGKVRRGADLDVKRSARVDVEGEVKRGDEGREGELEREMVGAPGTERTWGVMGGRFVEVLRGWKGGS
ncbi:MAG: hypothetical protein Q9227_007122 [Pyrenula ochraceoflavens]